MVHSKKTDELIICKIYSNDCRHCIDLIPIWDEMKTNISKKMKHMRLQLPTYLEIEAGNMEKLTQFNNENRERLHQDVTYDGFPTCVKIYKNKIEYYQGERDAISMENWYMKEIYTKYHIPPFGHKKTFKHKQLGGSTRKRKHRHRPSRRKK